MQTIIITGGTGLVGKALTKSLLEKNYAVVILTRGKTSTQGNVRYAHWNIEKGYIDPEIISSSDHIIHLAGAGVADKRWSAKRKKEIVESRVASGKLIADVLARTPNKIESVISASAIGWYGADPVIPNPSPFVETDPPSNDFLGDTCLQWEESLRPVENLGKRLVKVRTGIVLSKGGGAMREFIKPLRLGCSTILGKGNQVISWIHIDDLVNIYIAAIENKTLRGPYNAVAPAPVSNRDLVLTLAKTRNGSRYIPIRVPSFVLRTVLGEMSIEVLKSATVSSGKIERIGFVFQYPVIQQAIDEIVG